jgi:hypothetical protein
MDELEEWREICNLRKTLAASLCEKRREEKTMVLFCVW